MEYQKTKDELSGVDKEFLSNLEIVFLQNDSFVERFLYHSGLPKQVLKGTKFVPS